MANRLEFETGNKKKGKTISVRLEEDSEFADLIECTRACGFDTPSNYVRAALYFAKPVLLRFKNNPSVVLSIISQMVKVN
jgi:hypothetical protein